MLCVPLRHVLNKIKIVCNVRLRSISVWTNANVVVSPYQDVQLPDSTIVDYIWTGLDKWPTKTAAVCAVTNRSYTYEQMYKLSRNLAANLRKKFNIDNDDVVGVMSPNIPEYPIVASGILSAGGVVTTLNPIYTAYEIQRQLELSEVKLVIAHVEVVDVVKEALKLAKKSLPIIAITIGQSLPEGTVSYEEIVEDQYVDLNVLKDVHRKPNDVAFLPYSSGTTGLPKGVELTNRNFIANCKQQNPIEIKQYNSTTDSNQDAVLAILPFFHSYGLSIIMLHKLACGLKLVTLPRFKPDTFLNAIIRYRINLMYLAPPMVLFLGSNPQVTSKHFDTLNTITSGAAPLPQADIDKLMTKAQRDVEFSQGYGMTEASPLVTLSPRHSKNYESVGPAIPNVQLRVVDAKMNNLGPGESGELVIRGPNIMKGYKNNPEANKEVFLKGNWYRSGDVAKIDENGYVYITDRLKELIKVKGYQVAPAELEGVLKEHPKVHDAAVIGIPDPKNGERPLAFVVVKDSTSVKEEDIVSFIKERVAPYKIIQDVMFLDSIPKNASGKILRRELKEKYS